MTMKQQITGRTEQGDFDSKKQKVFAAVGVTGAKNSLILARVERRASMIHLHVAVVGVAIVAVGTISSCTQEFAHCVIVRRRVVA